MSKLLSVTATKILHDPHLRNTITNGIQSIMKDGKIDSSDIPDIMLILMECTNNLEKINLTYNQLVEVLEEVILFILEEQNVIPDDKKENIYKMIRTSIKLVLLQPKLKSCLSGVWTKLKNILCCGKSNNTTNITNTNTNIIPEVTHVINATTVDEPIFESFQDIVPETIQDTVPETIQDTVPETIQDTVQDVSQ
jgi:hypothetical protein